MNFIEAVRLLKFDKNVTLMRRGKSYKIILTREGYFDIGNKYTYFIPLIDDVLAEDWYVVKNEKLHTFEEAIAAYKRGEKIRRKNNKHNIMYYDEYFSNKDCLFDRDDVMANDWIIMDEEETK